MMANYPAGFHSSAAAETFTDEVFGDFENFERADPPAACRTIEITPQVRALDALTQAPRRSTWNGKALVR